MTDNNEFDVADLRREYIRGGLRRSDLTENPLGLFERWLNRLVMRVYPIQQPCVWRQWTPTASPISGLCC